MNGDGQLIGIFWEDLAFVFAILPGITGLAYCYTCGKTQERPTWLGYWNLLRNVRKAKSEAYRKTADVFCTPSHPAWTVGFLAWLFMFIVAFLGPSQIITLFCLLICIPGSRIAYLIGKKQGKLRDK